MNAFKKGEASFKELRTTVTLTTECMENIVSTEAYLGIFINEDWEQLTYIQ